MATKHQLIEAHFFILVKVAANFNMQLDINLYFFIMKDHTSPSTSDGLKDKHKKNDIQNHFPFYSIAAAHYHK